MITRISLGVFIFGWVLLYLGNKYESNLILLASIAFLVGGIVGIVAGLRSKNWNKFPLNKL